MPRLILTVLLGISLWLAVALTGNGDAIDVLNIQDDAAIPAGELNGARTLGQTFIAHQPNLHSIELRWIASGDAQFAGASQIILHLRRANESADVATVALPASSLQHNQFARFDFSPLADSQNQAFYFFLDASRANLTRGFVSVWASGEDIYPDGALIIDGAPTNRDLAFRAYTQPSMLTLVVDAFTALAENFCALAIIIGAPAVIGWLLLFLVDRLENNFISVAPLGLAMLSASALLVVKFGIIAAWGIVLALAMIAFWHWRKFRARTMVRTNSTDLVLIALAALSLAVGLLQIRDLPVPLWVDSPAHVDSVQVLAGNNSRAIAGFYHFGFHSAAAWLSQIAGIPSAKLVLLFGQGLLTLSGLTIFALTQKLTGNAVAGIASAVCVWFLAPTPAYFITWGRYPLLLGVVLCPIALCLAIEFIDWEKFDAGLFALAMLAGIGMLFAHLRLAVPYAVFLIFYQIVHAKNWRAIFLLTIGALGGIVWIGAFVIGGVPLETILARNAEGVELIDLPTALAVLLTQHGALVWLIAAASLLVAIFLRRQNAFLIGGWALATFFIAFIPIGSSLVAPSFVLLLAFLPASLVIGETIAALAMPGKIEKVVLAMLAGIALIGAYSMQAIVNPATVLFTSADQAAMEWLTQHTPGNARVLVNSFAWFGDIYIPSDGGIWLAQQTGRRAIALDANSAAVRDTPVGLARWLDENQIAYIYLGRRAGILNKTQFACQPERYTPVYYRDGVAIFAMKNNRAESPPLQLPFACPP